MPVHFSDDEYAVVAAAAARLIPTGEDPTTEPGASEAGVADYIDRTLGAFSFDPPHIWAGGPFSGRHGGDASFEHFVPLTPIDELAWRIRIEGTRGIAEREFNGPHRGWQEAYADGLAALGGDFAALSPADQDARLTAAEEFTALLYEHACEGMYGDPVYGGNRGGIGWAAVDFPGDVQPRGWTDDEVTHPSAPPEAAQAADPDVAHVGPDI